MIWNNYPKPAGFATAADGYNIPYFVYGKDKQQDLFIFNGFSCNQYNVSLLAGQLAQRFRVISYDYRGHGISVLHNRSHGQNVSVKTFVEDAVCVMDELAVKKSDLLGYSAGAQFMFEFARLHPDRSLHLIALAPLAGKVLQSLFGTEVFGGLADIVHTIGKTPFLSAPLKMIVPRLVSLNPELLWQLGAMTTMLRSREDRTIDFIRSLQAIDFGYLTQLLDVLHKHDAMPWLHTLENRTLFLPGENDLIVPPTISWTASKSMKNAQVVVIPSASHNSILENYGFIDRHIKEFALV